MDANREDWKQLYYGKPKKTRVDIWQLLNGNIILATGKYSLCVHVANKYGGLKANKHLKIKPAS